MRGCRVALGLVWSLSCVTAFVISEQKGATVRRPRQEGVRMQATNSVKTLLASKRSTVDALASVAPDASELTRLRFALAFPSQAAATKALRATVAWRGGAGKGIVEAADKAVREAMAGGSWDNEPVRLAAPHAATINRFITPKNILTLSTADGDLVYIIRASLINDNALMSKVSVKQLSEFFAYVKEVHSIVANARSERSGRLCEVIFANDISGIRVPPNSKFSKALTSSSEQYEPASKAHGEARESRGGGHGAHVGSSAVGTRSSTRPSRDRR